MLGKNQIMRIEKLNALEKLDVLDLHSNRIREVQNISHLKHLRCLDARRQIWMFRFARVYVSYMRHLMWNTQAC